MRTARGLRAETNGEIKNYGGMVLLIIQFNVCIHADRLSNVMMHGDLCIPATLCHHNRHPSKIILSNTQELLHLTWRALEARRNVNRTYSSTTDTNMFCFRNVTESFLFLEYCEEGRMPCVKDTRFCCNWLEFVARTCVNVNGSKYCSSQCMDCFQLHCG